jgi:predicted glycoside hydrolase/deacetylase ChbG (UPF0249 family)
MATLAQRLGLAPDARVLILHADDVGLCHAANEAFWQDLDAGVITCSSVMMPCPWVPEMAAWCRAHPTADVGVHLTLTSEWEGYRWKPVSTSDPQSGLIDDEGYMWRSVEALYSHMDPDAAIAEMHAQLDLALALGIDVSHLDTHMGAVAHPALAPAYMQLAVEHDLPAMMPRLSARDLEVEGIPPSVGQELMRRLDVLEDAGFPALDRLFPSNKQGQDLAAYCRWLDGAEPGVAHVRLHPALPGPEIEAITHSWGYRVADYQVMLRPGIRDYLTGHGIHTVGYRALRDLMRGR